MRSWAPGLIERTVVIRFTDDDEYRWVVDILDDLLEPGEPGENEEEVRVLRCADVAIYFVLIKAEG